MVYTWRPNASTEVHKNASRDHCFDSWCMLVSTTAAGEPRRTLGVPRMGIKEFSVLRKLSCAIKLDHRFFFCSSQFSKLTEIMAIAVPRVVFLSYLVFAGLLVV